MNNLWSFGDSYTEIYPQDTHNEQYLNNIAKQLNITHQSLGLSGTSLSYTSYCFNTVRHNIEDNDYVVIVLTNLFRRWFFEKKPKDAALNKTIKRYHREAMKTYNLYLNNPRENETALLDFLYHLNYISEERNLKTLILYGFVDTMNYIQPKEYNFEYIHFANGLLDDIQRKEFKQGVYNEWTKLPIDTIGDSRLNHMLKTNHSILADKIVDHFTNNTTIDLNTDFIQEQIGIDTKLTLQDEFFGNDWMFGL